MTKPWTIKYGGITFTDAPNRDPDVIRRKGGEFFHRWLYGQLPAVMEMPLVFRNDGLTDEVEDWGDWSGRLTGECEPNPDFINVISQLDNREWWLQSPLSHGTVRQVEERQKAKRKADKDISEARKPDPASAKFPDWYLKLTAATIAKAESAKGVDDAVSAASISDWYFQFASGNKHDKECADAMLVYLSQFPLEPRVFDALDCIKDRLRVEGVPGCPWPLVDLRPASSRRSDAIRKAFMRAAALVLSPELPVDECAAVVADIFGVSEDVAAKAGIRHDFRMP